MLPSDVLDFSSAMEIHLDDSAFDGIAGYAFSKLRVHESTNMTSSCCLIVSRTRKVWGEVVLVRIE